MQEYVNQRAKAKISPVTIRKEIATLRAAWNWGEPMGLTEGKFPNRGLRYPKADEKPPFMTMAEIERQIAGGGDPRYAVGGAVPASLRNRRAAQHVKEQGHRTRGFTRCSALPPIPGPGGRRYCGPWSRTWTSPGNRRSCARRSGAEASGPPAACRMTPFLKEVLREWLAVHPGGPALFCHAGTVARSKKRSRTTGHQNEKKRPSSLKGRMAGVRKRADVAQASR